MRYLNLSAYRFVRFSASELPDLRDRLLEATVRREFRGTILLSEEGLNINLAGDEARLREFQSIIADDARFANLEYKESWSGELPFRRMLVKIKREIIAFGVEGVEPEQETAPYIEPKQLRAWLDEGRAVRLVDTRNRYEVALGTFEGAEHLPIDTFRSFPEAVSALGEPESTSPDTVPVVTFCTGGIRCEKASALMLSQGMVNVFQLRGGILRYFEECGGAHYDGECFVYDRRVALDPELRETDTVQCFNCHHPVTPEEQGFESYVPDVSCPHCVDGKPRKLP